MNSKKILAVVLATTMLAACQQAGGRPGTGVMNGGAVNKQDIGTIAGAVAGGVVGHNIGGGTGQTVATIAGTLIGAGLGASIGSSLDKADMGYYNQTSQRALETAQPGQALPWNNPQTGNSGTVTPSNYYQDDSGRYCREYTQTIKVGGKTQQGHGTACREPDGTWKIVE